MELRAPVQQKEFDVIGNRFGGTVTVSDISRQMAGLLNGRINLHSVEGGKNRLLVVALWHAEASGNRLIIEREYARAISFLVDYDAILRNGILEDPTLRGFDRHFRYILKILATEVRRRQEAHLKGTKIPSLHEHALFSKMNPYL